MGVEKQEKSDDVIRRLKSDNEEYRNLAQKDQCIIAEQKELIEKWKCASKVASEIESKQHAQEIVHENAIQALKEAQRKSIKLDKLVVDMMNHQNECAHAQAEYFEQMTSGTMGRWICKKFTHV